MDPLSAKVEAGQPFLEMLSVLNLLMPLAQLGQAAEIESPSDNQNHGTLGGGVSSARR